MFDDRARLVEAGILEMADDEGIVAFPLGAHGVADHLARAAHLDNRMGIGIVRRDAVDLDLGTGIDDGCQVRAQAVPVGLAVLVIDVALIPDPHVRPPARTETHCRPKML